jgi:anaerobic ribonucleoside-triphosphate reductase
MVHCKKIIKNYEVSNWVKLKFSNNKELVVTDDHPLYLENKGRTFVKNITINDEIYYKTDIVKVISIEPINNKVCNSYDVETETDKFCLSGFNSGNCRTRVIGNVNGEEISDGRGNLSFVTINLPAIAIRSSKKSNSIEEFWKELEEKLIMCAGIELDRFEIQAKKKFRSFPFLMQQGLYYTSNDKKHSQDDEIREIIKQRYFINRLYRYL